jgi:hypothetical protein
MSKIDRLVASLFFFLLMFSLQRIACLALPASESPEQLSISLDTNKRVYHPHDEIIFSETFKNRGKEPIFIYDDTCYYGNDVIFKRVSDGKHDWETSTSATHTVETGFRPSKSVALKPGEEYKRTFSAFVTGDFHVAFQSHVSSGGYSGFRPGRTGAIDLPSKFVGCGEIYNLGHAGSYLVSAEYRNQTQWFNGDEDGKPKKPAWIGKAKSNEVTLKFEER